MLLNPGDREGLAQTLTIVLSDENLHEELRRRSNAATLKYFSWDAVAFQFIAALSVG
jgi:glycosyltransferase involved in cell wall biosynthesis